MAIIGKIREKSWLIVGLIGLALIAFILTDYNSWFGYKDNMVGYGSVDGEPVDTRLYETAVNNYKGMDQNEFMRQQREYGPKDEQNSENKAWNAIVDSLLLSKEFKALGISVSDREFDAYLYGTNGFTVMPQIAQNFTDPATGLFSVKLLRNRVEEMKKSTNAEDKIAWEQTKTSLTMQRLEEKYIQVLQQGVYVTKLEAKDQYVAQNRTKSISFVVKRFSEISDDEIKISDKQLEDFYNQKKSEAKYKVRSNQRDIKYFAIDIAPSKADSVEFESSLSKIKNDLAQLKTDKQDSTYVVKNSDWPVYWTKASYRSDRDAQPHQQQFTYPAAMDSVFKRAQVGDIVGPYEQNGKYRIAKIHGFENTLLTVRHILLQVPRTDTTAVIAKRKVADSLMTIINKDNFESLVAQYSEDGGSSNTGGKYEDFTELEMVKEFSDFAKNNPIGKIGYVQTDFGFHIIEVLDKKAGHLPSLVIVEKTLAPSSNSLDDLKLSAEDLVELLVTKIDAKKSINEKVALFDTIARKKGYFPMSLNIDEKSMNIYGMNTIYAEDRMIALGFSPKATAGDMVTAPVKDGNRYVIAMLTAVKDKGIPTFEAVEETMRRDLMIELKAKRLMAKFKGGDIQSIAKNANAEIFKAEVTFANPSIVGGGYEPEVVGQLFSKGIKDGTLTMPLIGKGGVYQILVEKTIAEPATVNYEEEQNMMIRQGVNSIQNDARRALREKSDVKDNRRFIKAGIQR